MRRTIEVLSWAVEATRLTPADCQPHKAQRALRLLQVAAVLASNPFDKPEAVAVLSFAGAVGKTVFGLRRAR